MHSFAEL